MHCKLNRRILAIVCSVSVVVCSGCLFTDKELPTKYRIVADEIVGTYYREDESGKRTDGGIAKFRGKDYAYTLAGVPGGDPKDAESMAFNLFQVGKVRLAFLRTSKGYPASQKFMVYKLESSRTQQVFTPLDPEFFKQNPGALPKTRIENKREVITSADADVLAAFFMLHGANRKIWDTEKAMMLNRIGT